MMPRHRITALMIVSLAACAPSTTQGPSGTIPAVIQIESGHEFEIAVGQEAQIRDTPVTLRFRGISQDSRCPSDVQCVWAGNAVAQFTLSSGVGPASEINLNTTLDPKSAVFSGYRITLVGLSPVPRSGSTIPQASYVATLTVGPA